jgi:hypothetical protein
MLKPHEILERAIPRGLAQEIAERLGVSSNLILQMRREPLSDESPTATGRVSWVERTTQLVDALILTNPAGAGLLVEWIHHYYLRRTKIAGRIPERDRHQTASDYLAECVEAVTKINSGAEDDEVQAAILRAQDALTRAMLSLTEGRKG